MRSDVVNSSKENPNKIAQRVTLTWLPTIFDQAIKFVVGYVRDSLNTATHISLEIESDRNSLKNYQKSSQKIW
jgi:PhoPQ-activated pathogenicity-related protein